jgi:hypothetical protein
LNILPPCRFLPALSAISHGYITNCYIIHIFLILHSNKLVVNSYHVFKMKKTAFCITIRWGND